MVNPVVTSGNSCLDHHLRRTLLPSIMTDDLIGPLSSEIKLTIDQILLMGLVYPI